MNTNVTYTSTGKQLAGFLFIIVLFITGCGRKLESLEGITTLRFEPEWYFRSLAWSPDGQAMLTTITLSQRDGAIYILDLTTGAYRSLPDYTDRYLEEAAGPEWSPNGHELIVTYPVALTGPFQGSHTPPLDTIIIDASTGEMVQEVWDGGYATWGSDQDSVIVLDTDVGRSGQDVPIYRINLDSGESEEIGHGRVSKALHYEAFDVSVAGALVYLNNDGLQIISTENGSLLGQIRSTNSLYSPTWSPDGLTLVYIEEEIFSSGESEFSLALSSSDGSCRSTRLNLGEHLVSTDWSPDGQQLAFVTQTPGIIYFLDLTEGVGKEWYASYQNVCLGPSNS